MPDPVDLADAPVAKATIRASLIAALLGADTPDYAKFRAYRYADGSITLVPLAADPPGVLCPVEGCGARSASQRGASIHLSMCHPDWLPPRRHPAVPTTEWEVVLRCGECDHEAPTLAVLAVHTHQVHNRLPLRVERIPRSRHG